MRYKTLQLLILSGLFLALGACGFKLKQSQSLDPSIQDMQVVQKNIDPEFINLLEKTLQQNQITLNDTSENELHILDFEQTKRAIATNTVNAKQTETRITYTLNFSFSQKNKQLLSPSKISRSKEYQNDNTNIAGKVEEERLLKKIAQQELINLLLRRLASLHINDAQDGH